MNNKRSLESIIAKRGAGGRWKPRIPAEGPEEEHEVRIVQRPVNEYTLVHFGVGVGLGAAIHIDLGWLILLHIAFEIVESTPFGIGVFHRLGWHDYVGDSAINSNIDTAAFALGILVGKTVRGWKAFE